MLGAIYVGLSGMDAYSTGLQMISNNVANLNTAGFKAKTVRFSDLFSDGGTGGLTFLGSSFANGIGNGVKIGDPIIDFSEGTLQQTGNALDLAIQGSGFLVLLKDGETRYTRTGSFAVDNDGNISQQGTGYKLGVLDASGQAVALNVDDKRTSLATATTKITFSGNLSSTSTDASVSSIDVYDDQGNQQVWTVHFTKPAASSDSWTVEVDDATGATVGTGTLNFVGSNPDPTANTITINTTPSSGDTMSVLLDFSGNVTSTGISNTIQTASVDGNAAGNLSTVTVDDTGQVLLTYSNGKTKQEGAVAIADFRDPQTLEQLSGGLFRASGNSKLEFVASGTNGVGTLVTGQIEASNVDLSKEFGDLILVQRGFQACSEVLSVSNDMIQQLFGIRGQG